MERICLHRNLSEEYKENSKYFNTSLIEKIGSMSNIMLYFDTLLALFILLALIIYFRNHDKPTLPQILILGLLMGLATLFKQHAWLAVGLVGLWLVIVHRHPKFWIPYGLAVLTLPLIQWGIMASQGILESYIFWNWEF